jgi:hypothetical protein
VSILGGPTITGQVANIASAFVDPPNGSEVTIVSGGFLLGGPTTTWTLNAGTQTLDFSYAAPALALGTVVIRVKVPSASPWTTSSWLFTNKWYQDAYYALSSGYAINGAGSCGGAGPPCVTINNTAAVGNNKEAVVITTGRALPGQRARPVALPASPGDFLEAENQTPADLVFERNLRTSAFNDQPAVVRP